MKHTKQNGGMARHILAFALTACMVTTSYSPIVLAQAVESTSSPILLCGFAELPNEIKERSVPLGVSLEKLNLPDTLEAVVDSALKDTAPVLPATPDKPLDSGTPSGDTKAIPPLDKGETLEKTALPSGESANLKKPAPPVEKQPKQEASTARISEKNAPPAASPSSTEPVTIHSVTWESAPLYSENNPGTYVFTAAVPERYVLADGVAIPKISVTVYDGKTAGKIVSSWQWNDPENYISEGVLALPGVSKENPITLDVLISMLPTSILATLNASEPSNTPVPISLMWSSKDFAQTQDGSFPVQGDYKFTATMQEGYTLSADAPSLEITVRLGGAMLLPANGTFTALEIREGAATGPMVVNLLDETSAAGNWALKPGADYYLYADLTAPAGAEHIQIYYGDADVPNGVTFANPPGGKYVPNKFDTHDYLDELLSYKNLPDPTYGSKKLSYDMQDGEMIYHIKKKTDTSTNTVFAIGLVVKDALYDGSGSIKKAVSVAVGSYAAGSFTPEPNSQKTFDLKIAEKGKFYSYLDPNNRNAAIGENGESGTMQYLANIAPDQPEILYDEASFDLTYPTGAEFAIGLNATFSKAHETFGSMTVEDAVPSADGKAQTVHVTMKNGLKASASHASCFVRLNFPDNAGFKPGEEYLLTTANVKLTMGATKKDVEIKKGWNQIRYTLTQSGLDTTSLTNYDRIAYNHTIDAPAQSYLVPLGNAWFKNNSTGLPTPYDKTFEAEYNVTNTAANVSYITIPLGLNISPTIEWRGVTADGSTKNGTISEPGTYRYRGETFYFLPAEDFGIVSFTGAKADIGALPAGYKSVDGATSWLFAKDNLAGAYGYFTTDEPGIQVVNNYRLYNTDPALRDRLNGDLSTTATGTSSDYCGIGWSGAAKLNNGNLTTNSSINAGEVASLSGFLYPYTAPSNGKGNGGIRGTATLVIDPIIYLTLPQGMSVVEKDLKFEIKKQDFQVDRDTAIITTISHQIENVSYLNTTGDGVSIYKITFPKGTRLGYFDETGNQSQLNYTIPLLTSKSLETRRYGLSELLCVTAQNQPEATKYSGQNQGGIDYALADKYGINGGKSLGTFAMEKGNSEGTIVTSPIGFGVQQSSEINLYSAVSVTKIGGEAIPQAEQRWYAYSSDPNSIALLGQNSEGRLRLQVSNTSGTGGDALRIVLPIPQKDADLGNSFMDTPPGFTMSMTYDKTASDLNFTAKYIKTTGTYDTITDKENIVAYTECPPEQANAVLFTAETVTKGEYYIYLDFSIAGGTPKSMDIWRPVYAYAVATDRRVSYGSYVASEVAASSISGVAFADVNRNGIQDEGEDGAADVTVVARDEKNRIASTQTAKDGSYQFLAIRESMIDMSFALSTEGQKTLRFNVPPLPDTAPGIASTVTPSADGLTASKTFAANAGEEKVHAAVDGFVSLSYNGGVGATGNLPKTGTHVKGTSVTVAVKPDNLAVKGKRFTGWNTEQNGTGTAYQPGASIRMSQSMVLYAQWELASYTVTFNYRGATSGNDESSRALQYNVPYGALPAPAKNGYDFKGWCSSAAGTSANVTAATRFTTGADTMLYALWTPKSMTVSYNNGGGSGTIANKTVSWEDPVLPTDAQAKAFTKNGYTLSGWSYQGIAVTGLDTYGSLAVTDSIVSIELVAQWKSKTGFMVKYDLDGGTVDSAATIPDKTNVSWTQSSLLPAKNPVKDNFSFKGWRCGATAATGSSTYGALATTDSTMEITLTAQWEPKSNNTVIYDTAGGSAISEKTGVTATDTNLLPTETSKKPGYQLTGWKSGDKVVDSTTVYNTLSSTDTLTLTAQWAAKSYTIRYTPGNGGSIPDATKSWSDGGLLPTPAPTRKGYTFGGWYYGSTRVAPTTQVSALIPQDDTDTIMLTAKWVERTYTVNYNSDGGTTFPQKNNVKYTEDGLLPEIPPTKLGYSFDGWTCGGNPVAASTACSTLLTSDTDSGITLVAQWKAKTGFIVQYDTDGGTPSSLSPKTVAWNNTKLLPTDTITKSGYTPNGWLSGRIRVTDATAFSTLAQSDQPGTGITLVAQWTEKSSYIVQYDTGGGSAVADKTGVKWTGTALLPTTPPTKAGYNFVKWQHNTTNVDATTAYNTLAADDTTAQITLKAVWTEKSSYIVKYNSDGGTAVAEKTGVKWTDAALLPSDNPIKSGYTFEKWQHSTNDVSASDTYGALAVTEQAEITLKAVWTEKSSYTVTYNTDGGSAVADKANVKWTSAGLLPTTNPTKAGYTLVKWQHDNNDVSASDTYGALAVTDTTTKITLKAVWAVKDGYTVKYNTSGGSAVAEKTGVKWTDAALLPGVNPTKTDYAFVEWQYSNVKVTATDSYGGLAKQDTVQSITLDAVWALVADNTVRYDTGGGTVISDLTGVKATDKNLLPSADPQRAGYQFTAWKSGNTPVTNETIYSALTSEKLLTLTAQWAEKSNYTVKYDTNGGTAVADKTSVKWMDSRLLPAANPTRSGYTFEKWQLDGADVLVQNTYGALAVTEKAEITLKAVWTEKSSYTVTYNTDGGSAVADKTSVKWTDAGLLPTTNPTKAGYTFVKWQHGNTDVDATIAYNALAADDTTMKITLKAVWTEKTYTISYAPDNGTTIQNATKKWIDAGLLPTPEPIKTGYTFGGWYYSNTKVEAATTVAALIPLDDKTTISLTAYWSAVPGKLPDISGNVEDEKGSTVENATVKLTQGSETKYGPVTTNAQGQYLLPNVKPAIYNLVAEKANQIVTVIITVEKNDLQQKLILPAAEKNSVLEVQGADTPPVVVGNLDEIAKGTPLVPGETSLTIKLTVQKEAEQTSGKPEHTEIRQTAGANATILFLDAALTKQVDANPPENIGNSNSVVLELVIPFDLTGKENLRVYRHHTDVDAFTALNAKPAAGAAQDKTYYADVNAGLIHAYARKFSAYAIAYDKTSGGGENPGGGSGSETPTYTITPKSGAGGQITPDRRITVNAGESAGFSMAADKGYQIADVKVDGRSVGATSQYIFTNIWSDRTIEVLFKKTAPPQPPATGTEQPPDDTPTDNKPGAPDDGFDRQKEDVKDDITKRRDEAITALPDTLTDEQRQAAIDELNKICDDARNAIDRAKTADEVSDILNAALQAYRDTVEKFGGEIPVSRPADPQGKQPFILLSALLALAAVLLAVLEVLEKSTRKRKLFAILGAVAAVLIFLVTTGWSGIAFANFWTLAVALAAALPAVCIMQKKEDEETEEDAPQ